MFFWKRKAELLGPYLGQLSIDVGDAYTPSPIAPNLSAWRSNPLEMAEGAWEQLLATLPSDRVRATIPDPEFFHIDAAIKFTPPAADDAPEGAVTHNETPFYVQVAGHSLKNVSAERNGPEPEDEFIEG